MIRRDRIQPNKNERLAQETDVRQQGDGPKTGTAKSDGKLASLGKGEMGFITVEPKPRAVSICQRSGFCCRVPAASEPKHNPAGEKGTGRQRSAAGPLLL